MMAFITPFSLCGLENRLCCWVSFSPFISLSLFQMHIEFYDSLLAKEGTLMT